jgi:hypothetical protein
MDKNSSLSEIGSVAFAKCTSLRSFVIPRDVGTIVRNCVNKSICLDRLSFESPAFLYEQVGDRRREGALAKPGLNTFPGWASIGDGEFTVVQDIH